MSPNRKLFAAGDVNLRTVFEFVSHHPHGLTYRVSACPCVYRCVIEQEHRRREFENSFRIRVTSPTRTHLSRIGMSMCISLSHRARTVFEFVSHHPHGHFPGNHSLYSHNSNTQILSRRREFENSFRIRVTSPTRTHLSRIGMSMCISLCHRARTPET